MYLFVNKVQQYNIFYHTDLLVLLLQKNLNTVYILAWSYKANMTDDYFEALG